MKKNGEKLQKVAKNVHFFGGEKERNAYIYARRKIHNFRDKDTLHVETCMPTQLNPLLVTL